MNNSFKKFIFLVLLGICLLKPADFRADIVYPARLELTETEPGVFNVFFTLPVINGKVIKASPILPGTCNNLSEPKITGTAYSKNLSWKISCNEEPFYGKQIGIEGLQGSQVEILLVINLLDGRSFNKKLSPSMAYFEVPYPPGFLELLKTGTFKGARTMLLQHYFYLLVFGLIFLLKVKNRKKYYLFLFLSILTGYFLGNFELIKIPGWMFPVSVLIALLLLGLKTSGLQNIQFSSLLILVPGLFLGNLLSIEKIDLVLTPGEELVFAIFFSLGIALGLLLVVILFSQLKNILKYFKVYKKFLPALSIIIGSLSLGLLIFELSLFWRTTSMLPQIPGISLLFILLIPLLISRRNLLASGFSFAIFSVFGLILLMNGFSIPYAEIMLLGLILLSLVFNLLKPVTPRIFFLVNITIGAVLAGNILGSYANDNLSFPLARSIGYLAMAIFLIGMIAGILPKRSTSKMYHRVWGLLLLSFGLMFFGNLFLEEYFDSLASEYVNGILPVPILSLILLIFTIIAWPRNRRIHKQMNLETRKPLLSISLLVLALILLPFHFGIKNPWYEAQKLDKQGMKLVMENVLSNTYTAFNEEDEEKLFEALSQNVDAELLDNVYLDSRRRLSMGLREGAEVSVEEVKLNELGDPAQKTDSDIFEYPVKWTVTARVRHLKHIHYRKNSYTGTVALKSIDNQWKISKISLSSEDRKVMAASNL
ncbi:hypothetical protein ML462_03825 [Gramella lutea]|uniref:Uncharacterized protein n=1 Tax=Christiangramia lutea TaxID=1607951 RepID=A0A9X1V3R4_9FLAO|nr:hypothetical protein [Christiangramia lutea]MCH4822293.1 hypothetical protein [Christiangramia lutea]